MPRSRHVGHTPASFSENDFDKFMSLRPSINWMSREVLIEQLSSMNSTLMQTFWRECDTIERYVKTALEHMERKEWTQAVENINMLRDMTKGISDIQAICEKETQRMKVKDNDKLLELLKRMDNAWITLVDGIHERKHDLGVTNYDRHMVAAHSLDADQRYIIYCRDDSKPGIFIVPREKLDRNADIKKLYQAWNAHRDAIAEYETKFLCLNAVASRAECVQRFHRHAFAKFMIGLQHLDLNREVSVEELVHGDVFVVGHDGRMHRGMQVTRRIV